MTPCHTPTGRKGLPCVRPRNHPDPDLHMPFAVLCTWDHRLVDPAGFGDDLPAYAHPDDPTSAVMHQGCVVDMHTEHAGGTPASKRRH